MYINKIGCLFVSSDTPNSHTCSWRLAANTCDAQPGVFLWSQDGAQLARGAGWECHRANAPAADLHLSGPGWGSPRHAAHSVPEAPAGLSHSCPQQQAHINTHHGVVSFPSLPPLLSIGTSWDHFPSEILLLTSCLRVCFWGK